jgi:cytochrome P450
MSFLIAGRDTTSSALTFTFMSLGRRHDAYQRVVEEVCRRQQSMPMIQRAG